MANKINNLTPDEWYEKFMIALEEERKERREASAEFTADFKELLAESEADRKKSSVEFEKWSKEMQRQIGGMTKSTGAITEALIFNTLEKEMMFGGIEFDDIRPNMGYHSKKLDIRAEFDMVLTNGKYVAIIETKTKVDPDDVTELIEKKLDNFRKLYPEYNNHKIIFGIGGMKFDKRAEEVANKNGIGLIKVVGEKVEFHADSIKMY